jgi:hypothetical protein
MRKQKADSQVGIDAAVPFTFLGEPIAADSARPTDTKTSTGQNEKSEPQAVYHH